MTVPRIQRSAVEGLEKDRYSDLRKLWVLGFEIQSAQRRRVTAARVDQHLRRMLGAIGGNRDGCVAAKFQVSDARIPDQPAPNFDQPASQRCVESAAVHLRGTDGTLNRMIRPREIRIDIAEAGDTVEHPVAFEL